MISLWNRLIKMSETRLMHNIFLWDKSILRHNWSQNTKHLFTTLHFLFPSATDFFQQKLTRPAAKDVQQDKVNGRVSDDQHIDDSAHVTSHARMWHFLLACAHSKRAMRKLACERKLPLVCVCAHVTRLFLKVGAFACETEKRSCSKAHASAYRACAS